MAWGPMAQAWAQTSEGASPGGHRAVCLRSQARPAGGQEVRKDRAVMRALAGRENKGESSGENLGRGWTTKFRTASLGKMRGGEVVLER